MISLRRVGFGLLRLLTLVWIAVIQAAASQSTAFTYQGQLWEAGVPVTWPDLLLVVCAPEDMDRSTGSSILHVSSDIRQGAGLRESYVIRIPSQKLAAAGVAVPSRLSIDTDEPDAVI